jgi:flagellar basal-body rod protein FlgB
MKSLTDTLALYSAAADLRTQRHQLLASNVANADTPNFKARDIDFQQAMQKAMSAIPTPGNLSLATTAAGHIAANAGAPVANLQYRASVQGAVDGNTVDMDVERGQLADNALQYQILTQLIGDEFKGMRTALSSNNS